MLVILGAVIAGSAPSPFIDCLGVPFPIIFTFSAFPSGCIQPSLSLFPSISEYFSRILSQLAWTYDKVVILVIRLSSL